MKKYYLMLTLLIVIPIALYGSNIIQTGYNLKDYIPLITPVITGIFGFIFLSFKNNLDVFKVEIKHSVKEVQNTFSDVKADTVHLKEKVEKIDNKLHEWDVAKESKKEFKCQLEGVLAEALLIIEDPKVKQFAILKSNAYIDFIMDMRTCDFIKMSKEEFELKKAKGICIANEIRREGQEILGEEFINEYTRIHEPRTITFFNDLEELI
jgi:hypothetical protein